MEFLLYICLSLTLFSGIRADDSEALREAAIVQPTAIVNSFVTQNVYGFADFTTTIGNTVMIFSPSSIAVPEPVKEETTTTSSPPAAIETKPIADSPPQESIMIEPTKPVEEKTLPPPVVVSSVVEVVTEPPIVTKKPKKKKNKAASTPNPLPMTVQAITAVTPEPKVILSSKVEVVEEKKENKKFIVEPVKQEPVLSSVVEVSEASDGDESDESEIVLQDGNAISEPEYDFLSRQPTEFVEETYRVVNLKPSVLKKPKAASKTAVKNVDAIHPTGLVTKSGGTVVNNGLTTVHETSVIGTYISGKYAQVLQSTSQIFNANQKPKIQPSSTLRILKTAAPSLNKTPKYVSNEEELAVEGGPSLVRTSRRPGQAANNFKNRLRNREDVAEEIVTPSPPVNPYASGKKSSSSRRNGTGKNKSTRTQNKPQEVATVSAEPVVGTYSSRRNKQSSRVGGFKPSTVHAQQVVATSEPYNANRRTFKPKIQPSNVEQDQQQSTLYKFKLNRTPGRWQYKTTPKPRVTIRKHGGSTNEIAKESLEQLAATPPTDGAVGNDIVQSRTDLDVDLDGSGSVKGDVLDDEATGAGDNKIERKLPIETIKVEISTPADFSDTYYEIATIKSPYTFQVGANKNTRYITVTSTFEKTLDPEPTSTSILTEPLTENILAATSQEHNLLDSSIATLPVLSLGDDQPTPPLETLTETFSTTQVMLKTHILPVVRGTNTSSYTLIQTYHVTRLVTATKTLPPMDLYHVTRNLNEFNTKLDEAGSELHLELEFGDENEHDEDDEPRRVALPEDLNLANIGSEFDLSEVDRSKLPNTTRRPKPKPKTTEKPKEDNPLGLTPEQLALLRLLNPAAIPNVITTSKPVVKVETVYESHVLPIINGANTIFSTISRPVATVTKTDYEIGTSVIPQVTPPPINPILIQQQQLQQQFQIQSTPVVQQQIVTQTDSKVLKLTFGARTAYTTLYNTKVVPTMVTSYVTQSIAVQPSAFGGFPGHFPGYPPYFG